MMAVLAAVFLVGFGGTKLLGGQGNLSAPFWLDTLLLPIFVVAAVATFFVSYRISLGIFQKKEL